MSKGAVQELTVSQRVDMSVNDCVIRVKVFLAQLVNKNGLKQAPKLDEGFVLISPQ